MNNSIFNIAVLIDGDNAQAKLIKEIIEEVSKYGKVTIRRIYGDWTTPQMNSWKEILNNYSISPIQKFNYTTGKNSTDSSLIIDAMDILHGRGVHGFCIVSSDSDYTGLAKRIREEGLFVMGIGRKNTPIAFVNSCEIFTFTENLIQDDDSDSKKAKLKEKAQDKAETKGKSSSKRECSSKTTKKSDSKIDDKAESSKENKTGKKASSKNEGGAESKAQIKISSKDESSAESKTETKTEKRSTAKSQSSKSSNGESSDHSTSQLDIRLIDKAFDISINEEEEAYISTVGTSLRKLDPSFDSRTYGYRTLTKLFESLDKYVVVKNVVNGLNHPLVKLK